MAKERPLKNIGFIMDGNGRWALERGLKIVEGHREGTRVIRPLIERGIELGLSQMCFWALSTENLGRPDEEVAGLMTVIREALAGDDIKRLCEQGARFKFAGEFRVLEPDIVDGITALEARTIDNSAIAVTIALNYGGRKEVLRAVNILLDKGEKKVDEETFAQHLYMPDDFDVIARTAGDERTSGFAIWQGVYSELMFIKDKRWPEMKPEDLDEIVAEYKRRNRTFGKRELPVS